MNNEKVGPCVVEVIGVPFSDSIAVRCTCGWVSGAYAWWLEKRALAEAEGHEPEWGLW